jgi:natural product biosynthesis luciferase-like monooxygenase protein
VEPDLLRDAHELDKLVTKHERFWVKRLTTLHAPVLTELKPHSAAPQPVVLRRPVPASLSTLAAPQRQAALTAALAAYLTRVGDGGSFDLAFHAPLPGSLAQAFAAAPPLRCDVRLEASFATLSAQVAEELASLSKRQTYARDALQRYRPLRERYKQPPALNIGLRLGALPTLGAGAELVEGTQLSLVADDTAHEYAFVYDQVALSAESVARIAARFEVLLSAGLSDPQRPLAELAILATEERELLLGTWQDTRADYAADQCMHQLFEQQVARTPNAVAVVFRGASLSYAELNQRANRVAQQLRSAGVGPEVLVGICVERSLDLMVGLLGILKAGGAYVPLDPVYPRERLAIMLEDSKAPVLLSQRRLANKLPQSEAQVLFVDELNVHSDAPSENPSSGVGPDNVAYVIFTSGSTGRPKGVMVCHRNVSNFFTGMDSAIGAEPGVWLAVTSISFDISVLELFWTLTRGFEVVLQEESDRASLADERGNAGPKVAASSTPMDFGLFYFAADSGSSTAGGNAYRLLIEGAKFADTHDFTTVWTPERHFHAFGGLYPNPAVTTAALATITSRVALRAGSVVLPLHNPLRVAEDWSVIDQISGGRVGLSFASGWHINDFAFYPENYERRREVMLESIDTVLKLWRGEKVTVKNGAGQPIEVAVLPRPIQARPPIWIASAGSVDTFKLAGKLGFNVLTNMLGQDLPDLKNKLAAYREARREAGHAGPGQVTVMLHTFVCGDTEEARRLARKPFSDYLASSFDLVKVAPWMFPAFRQPSKEAAQDPSFDPSAFTADDMAALLDYAFDRYFDTAGLFGTPERALAMVEQLKGIGVNELACLIDFGVQPDVVLASLPHLDRLRQLSNPASVSDQARAQDDSHAEADFGIVSQLQARKVSHLQCTPSMARMLLSDPAALAAMRGLNRLMLGGEALPSELVEQLLPAVGGEIMNMYGPTETTIWSTTAKVASAQGISIGKPIANTVIRIVDAQRQLVPIGTPGELCIAGAGVVRGYLGRPDLTSERFVADPYASNQLMYRTGDLARYRSDGQIEFLGRLDHQVKVNGYRIELGEIESVLTRHPAVRQSVVVARGDDVGPAQLVGYVIATGRETAAASDKERVTQWQSLWDETYKQAPEDNASHDPRFNIAGWNDSYSAEPIAREQMREWLDATEQRILALSPKRVLEIGCGTGMVLYRVAPHVEHYTGVDLSAHALETIRRELTPAEATRVSLLQQPAHALEGVAERSCDTVIINSVAQYFPDADYLIRVLQRASELVSDGGRIFLGDVRSLAHLPAFQTLVELHQAPSQLPALELLPRIERRVAQDSELVLAEAFFHALQRELPRLVGADSRLKAGAAHNEMSCFRYDVVLYVGSAPPSVAEAAAAPPATTGITSLAEVTTLLSAEPPVLLLANLENARLSAALAAQRAIASKAPSTTEELRQGLARALPTGVDPAALAALDGRYEVELSWAASGDLGRFDALLRHKQHGPRGRWPFAAPKSEGSAANYANRPAKLGDDEDFFHQLRAHLREFLPEYMVPAAFVTMDAFPLTPNGKIDRKALPPPQRQNRRSADEYAPPSNSLEQLISGVWQQLLSLERVGRKDNIFDLGANSLLTVQANNRLSTLLERKVSLVSMFRFPTVESLAAHLGDDGRGPGQDVKRSHEKVERKKDAAARRRELRQERNSR